MPIDINELRSYKGGDPEKYKLFMTQRFKDANIVTQVVTIDEDWRTQRAMIDQMRKDANKLQKDVIAPKKKAKENCDAEVQQYKQMMDEIKLHEEKLPLLEMERDKLLNRIGNIVDSEVPISQNEDEDNLVVALSPLPSVQVAV